VAGTRPAAPAEDAPLWLTGGAAGGASSALMLEWLAALRQLFRICRAAPLNGLNERRRRLLDLWKRHNDHYGRSATGRAAVPALPPPWTGYPRFCAASRWGATAGLSHGHQCRASRSRRAAPAVGGNCGSRYPRSVLPEGGWTVAELAGRAVPASRGRQRRYPPSSTGPGLGH